MSNSQDSKVTSTQDFLVTRKIMSDGEILKNVRKLGQICQELEKCCANMESIIVNKINQNNSQKDTTVTLPLAHRTSPQNRI